VTVGFASDWIVESVRVAERFLVLDGFFVVGFRWRKMMAKGGEGSSHSCLEGPLVVGDQVLNPSVARG
jgi:hypothetical protein